MSVSALTSLFSPRSVAIIGPSEKNPWAGLVLGGLGAMEFGGPVHLVNRRGGDVLGRRTVPTVGDIGELVDSAFVMVPAAALEQTIEEMAQAGIGFGVVVTSGFAELGADGSAEQARLFGRARDLGVRLMGPNSLGFINFVDRVCLSAIPVELPLLDNPRVAVVSQSGATAGLICATAYATNIGLSHVVAMGNEALIDLAEVLDFVIDDPTTRAIAVFAETIRDPSAFLGAARRALAAEKPIVMLKVGVGTLAAEVAQAHTGALVGNDKVFSAICRDLGIIRVNTIEQLLQTAALLAHSGVLREGGFGVASMSGGTCEMIADLGEAAGVPFATLAPETKAKLQPILADYATIQNPLDVTGGVLSNLKAYGDAVAIVGADPSVSLAAACFDVPQTERREISLTKPLLRYLSDGLEQSGVPGFLLAQSYLGFGDYGRGLIAEARTGHYALGLGTAMQAVSDAFRWSVAIRDARLRTPAPPIQATDARPDDERQTLDFFESRGVPVVPARIVRSAAEAAAAADAHGGPVVLKILSPDIAHKTEVGGVALNIIGTDAAGAAFDAMMEEVAQRAPDARLDGVIVSPMRGKGVELIVGIARDPAWGPVLAVGIGGVLVEILADADLHLLPVAPADVEAMLGRLKATRLLDGYRGGPAVDRARLAEVIAAIGNAALALGPDLMSLEVNPLWASGDQVECLDALAIWKNAEESGH